MIVYSDFDGTITTCDTLQHLLRQFAEPEWRELEEAWLTGRLDTRTCLSRQLQMINASDEAIREVLDGITLDSGFWNCYRWLQRSGIPLEIVSDGILAFIEYVMHRHGFSEIPIRANEALRNHDKWTFSSPWWDDAYPHCATSKATIIQRAQAAGHRVVFIGDGHSDRYAATRADVLFAKGYLAQFCQDNKLSYRPYETFHDIERELRYLRVFSTVES